ncbi:MAG TPA: YihY/virulence factor BrkB family protein [Candidatus Sulfotelmatobacter sp.]|nr:YihY/virulence factor BrkB family protein [Candidatus Sulfotelmatobacter sp.]
MSRWVEVFRAAGARFSAQGSAFTAQAIAYTALFALVPLTLVGVSLLAFAFGTADGIAQANRAILFYVPALYDLLASNLQTIVRYRGVSGVVGFVGLAWGGKNLFQALTYALNRSLGLEHQRSLVWQVAIALTLVPIAGVVIALATALPIIITLGVQFAGLESLRWAPQIASYGASFALVFVVCALLYAYLPNRQPSWPAVCAGAAVAALGYSIAQIAYAIYTTYAAYAFQIYGALSALFVLLLWLDVIGVVFLFGAHVSAAWHEHVKTRKLPLAS